MLEPEEKLYRVRIEIDLFWLGEKPESIDDYDLELAAREEMSIGNASVTANEVKAGEKLSEEVLNSIPWKNRESEYPDVTVRQCLEFLHGPE